MITINENFLKTLPNAHIGILTMMGVENVAAHPALEARKRSLEAELRSRFTDKDIKYLEDLAPLKAYTDYY